MVKDSFDLVVEAFVYKVSTPGSTHSLADSNLVRKERAKIDRQS